VLVSIDGLSCSGKTAVLHRIFSLISATGRTAVSQQPSSSDPQLYALPKEELLHALLSRNSEASSKLSQFSVAILSEGLVATPVSYLLVRGFALEQLVEAFARVTCRPDIHIIMATSPEVALARGSARDLGELRTMLPAFSERARYENRVFVDATQSPFRVASEVVRLIQETELAKFGEARHFIPQRESDYIRVMHLFSNDNGLDKTSKGHLLDEIKRLRKECFSPEEFKDFDERLSKSGASINLKQV
jgi:thymidylate kinase